MSGLSRNRSTKAPGRTVKAQETRELLLEKAIDLFFEHGYSRTPIRKITESLRVENTIIYYYYRSKDELLFSIIDAIADDLINGLQDIVESVDDPLQRLRQMIYKQIVIFKHKKKEVKIFVEDNDKLPPHLRHRIQERQRRIYDIYAAQIKRLLRLGTLKEMEPSVIIFSLFGMINWIYRWFDENGPLTIEEVADRTIQIPPLRAGQGQEEQGRHQGQGQAAPVPAAHGPGPPGEESPGRSPGRPAGPPPPAQPHGQRGQCPWQATWVVEFHPCRPFLPSGYYSPAGKGAASAN